MTTGKSVKTNRIDPPLRHHETGDDGGDFLRRLLSAREIGPFIAENRREFDTCAIRDHIDRFLSQYGISKAQAIQQSNLERGYAYQILRGAKQGKRDKYIRLAMGIGLSVEDTQRLLTFAQHGVLRAQNVRDALILYAIHNRLGIIELERLLEEQHAGPLE